MYGQVEGKVHNNQHVSRPYLKLFVSRPQRMCLMESMKYQYIQFVVQQEIVKNIIGQITRPCLSFQRKFIVYYPEFNFFFLSSVNEDFQLSFHVNRQYKVTSSLGISITCIFSCL